MKDFLYHSVLSFFFFLNTKIRAHQIEGWIANKVFSLNPWSNTLNSATRATQKAHFVEQDSPGCFFGFKMRPCRSWSHLCKRMVLRDRDHVQHQLFPDKAAIHGPHWSAIVDFQFHSAECGRLPLWGWVAKWFSWEKDPEWQSALQSALSLTEMKVIPSHSDSSFTVKS